MKRWYRFGVAVAAMAATMAGAGAEPIPADVAQAVAEDTVARSFPGEEWTCWGQAVVEDAQTEGETAAWAFFFANPGSGFETEEAVREAILDGADGTDGESGLYSSTATVVTGARDTDSLVLRHFRGLPDWWQESVRTGIGGGMMVGPGDIRWVGAPLKAGVQAKSVAARRAASARQKARSLGAERAARRAEQFADWPPEWQAKAEEAEAEAQEARKGAWAAKAAALDNEGEGSDR